MCDRQDDIFHSSIFTMNFIYELYFPLNWSTCKQTYIFSKFLGVEFNVLARLVVAWPITRTIMFEH